MSAVKIPSEAIDFFSGLEENNNRDWFQANKKTYEDAVKKPFVSLIEEISRLWEVPGVPLRGGANTIFRINRDVRFSNDKSPYKPHISGLLTTSGSKNPAEPLVYLHMDAKGGFLAAGLWQPDTERLGHFRTRIIDEEEAFTELVSNLGAEGLSLDRSSATKMMPRGFADYAGHPHSDYIKLKNLIVRRDLSPKDWSSDSLVNSILRFMKESLPLLRFVSR